MTFKPAVGKIYTISIDHFMFFSFLCFQLLLYVDANVGVMAKLKVYFSSAGYHGCLHHDHFDIAVLHEVFPISVDEIFTAIFTDSSVQRSLMARRRTRGKIRHCCNLTSLSSKL